MKPPSKTKLKNFRKKIQDIGDQEAEMRVRVKALYEQFVLDVGDSEIALRHVRQAFFEIQKQRYQQQLAERMEFHPFFGAHPKSSIEPEELDEEFDDDDNIL